MTEPKGCPTPGACSALEQIDELTKERDHWKKHYEGISTAGDSLLEIERRKVAELREALQYYVDGRYGGPARDVLSTQS